MEDDLFTNSSFCEPTGIGNGCTFALTPGFPHQMGKGEGSPLESSSSSSSIRFMGYQQEQNGQSGFHEPVAEKEKLLQERGSKTSFYGNYCASSDDALR